MKGPVGLEQGFTVAARPSSSGAGDLTLAVRVAGVRVEQQGPVPCYPAHMSFGTQRRLPSTHRDIRCRCGSPRAATNSFFALRCRRRLPGHGRSVRPDGALTASNGGAARRYLFPSPFPATPSWRAAWSTSTCSKPASGWQMRRRHRGRAHRRRASTRARGSVSTATRSWRQLRRCTSLSSLHPVGGSPLDGNPASDASFGPVSESTTWCSLGRLTAHVAGQRRSRGRLRLHEAARRLAGR